MVEIEGFNGRYAITKDGRIWSNPKHGHTGMWINPHKDKDGYLMCHLTPEQGVVGVPVKPHRIVAQAYIPNPKNLPHVNHLNGNKQDNRVENLEWCTHADNMQHAKLNGLSTRPERAQAAKLDWQKVKDIRESNLGLKLLADLYGVHLETIRRVRKGTIWKV